MIVKLLMTFDQFDNDKAIYGIPHMEHDWTSTDIARQGLSGNNIFFDNAILNYWR